MHRLIRAMQHLPRGRVNHRLRGLVALRDELLVRIRAPARCHRFPGRSVDRIPLQRCDRARRLPEPTSKIFEVASIFAGEAYVWPNVPKLSPRVILWPWRLRGICSRLEAVERSHTI